MVHSHCHGTQRGPMGSLPPSGKALSSDFIGIYRVADTRIAEVFGTEMVRAVLVPNRRRWPVSVFCWLMAPAFVKMYGLGRSSEL